MFDLTSLEFWYIFILLSNFILDSYHWQLTFIFTLTLLLLNICNTCLCLHNQTFFQMLSDFIILQEQVCIFVFSTFHLTFKLDITCKERYQKQKISTQSNHKIKIIIFQFKIFISSNLSILQFFTFINITTIW